MYLAEFAFVSVNSIFGPMLLFYERYVVLVSHPNTNPTKQGLTSVKFDITYPLKLVVKRGCEGT